MSEVTAILGQIADGDGQAAEKLLPRPSIGHDQRGVSLRETVGSISRLGWINCCVWKAVSSGFPQTDV